MSCGSWLKKEEMCQVPGIWPTPNIIFWILDTFKKMPSPCGATASHLWIFWQENRWLKCFWAFKKYISSENISFLKPLCVLFLWKNIHYCFHPKSITVREKIMLRKASICPLYPCKISHFNLVFPFSKIPL